MSMGLKGTLCLLLSEGAQWQLGWPGDSHSQEHAAGVCMHQHVSVTR